MEKLVIIDNGHGAETAGKSSPHYLHYEWQWCRQAARKLSTLLNTSNITSVLLVPEIHDVPLAERISRANRISTGHNAVLVSLHNNAAGDGTRWHDARGWCAFVARQAGNEARRLASLLADEAYSAGLKGNRSIPPCGYLQSNFAILRHTGCPAVLTENMFMDNRADVEFLLSAHGLETLVNIHLRAILRYFNGI